MELLPLSRVLLSRSQKNPVAKSVTRLGPPPQQKKARENPSGALMLAHSSWAMDANHRTITPYYPKKEDLSPVGA
ncbi:hypothetical protein JTE90_019838 [Oedothorax gibbosus]|uniref:Uncharacterized protein n=1 Tax=Oedothorax gibbosus TaxID=931172 RepID=A0AAV6V7I6_9ARAC|nr:hypothetical protein JTE90_019838 [Oedothorax gibbosus]